MFGLVAAAASAPPDNAPGSAAASPTTRPTAPATSEVRKGGKKSANANEEVVLTAEEWVRLEQFMKQNSPKKWGMYLTLPENPQKQTLKNGISARFKSLDRVQATDEKHFEIELRAIKIEDEIYGCLQEIKLGHEVSTNDTRMRQFVDDLVSNRDEWKIERLRRVLQELKNLNVEGAIEPVAKEMERIKTLTRDDRKARVDKRVDEFKKHMDHPRANKMLNDERRPSELVGERIPPLN